MREVIHLVVKRVPLEVHSDEAVQIVGSCSSVRTHLRKKQLVLIFGQQLYSRIDRFLWRRVRGDQLFDENQPSGRNNRSGSTSHNRTSTKPQAVQATRCSPAKRIRFFRTDGRPAW